MMSGVDPPETSHVYKHDPPMLFDYVACLLPYKKERKSVTKLYIKYDDNI